LRGCKILVKICSIGETGDIEKLLRSPLGAKLWRLLRKSTLFVVPSSDAAGKLKDTYQLNLLVIPNPISVPRRTLSRSELRRRIGIQEKPVILFVARLIPEKGVQMLKDAWKEVSHDATLLIIGDGPLLQDLQLWAEQETHIHVLGSQQDVEPFYLAADVFVAPSNSETFGNSLAEAMSYGLAVISTPVGLAHDWIDHRRNGMIISGQSSHELTVTMNELLKDKELRERIGTAAREQVKTFFAEDQIADLYIRLFATLSSQKHDLRDSLVQSLWQH